MAHRTQGNTLLMWTPRRLIGCEPREEIYQLTWTPHGGLRVHILFISNESLVAISQQGLPTYSVDQGKPQTELLASCTVCALLLYAKSAITRSSWFHPRPDPSNQNCTITASGAFKPINENCSIVTNQDCILSPLHQIHSSQDLMNLDTSFTSNRAAWGPGWQLPL